MRRPFASARRAASVAENVHVRVRLSTGATGYGEGSPAPYVTGETIDSVARDAALAADVLLERDARRVREWSAALVEAIPGATARAAVECAVLDALARALGLPLWHWFGGATDRVQTDYTLTLAPPAEVARYAAEARAAGYRVLKIKVGTDPDEDEARVRAIVAAAPDARLRLDANQAFDPGQALRFVRRLVAANLPIELLEQPVPRDDWDGLAAVTRESPIPVIADEAIHTPVDVIRVTRTRAAHGVSLKLAKSGPLAALAMIAIARAAGLKLMLGCMLESLLGIGVAVHLACGTGAFDYLDLDAHALIGLAPPGRPFAQRDDWLLVPHDAAGHGWEPA